MPAFHRGNETRGEENPKSERTKREEGRKQTGKIEFLTVKTKESEMMKYSKLWKRCLAGLLCVSMTAASLAGNAVSTYAQAVPASGVPASAVSEESVPAAEDGQEEAVKTPDVQEMPDDAKSRAGVGEQDGADAQRQQSADAAQAAPDGQAAAETDGQDAGGVQAAPDGQAAEQAQDGQKAQDGTGAQAAEPPADTEPSAEEKPGNAQRMARVRAAAAGVLAEDVTALTEDESVDVRISEQGGVQWFSFTPEVSGRYVFASEGDYDTLAYLYADQQGEPLEENDDVSTSNANFALEYALEAGVTYYYAAQMCYDYVTGFFTVSVSYKR